MKKRFCFLLIAMLLVLGVKIPAYAYSPYESFVQISGSQQYFGYSQDMYTPDMIISGVFEKPQCIFIFEDKLYVADSRLKSIVVTTKDGELISYIGEGVLTEPTGVFVDEQHIYAADYGTSAVYKFTHSGELTATYTRPNNPLYGKNEKFKPLKLVADKAENVFVISEGGTNGVIQINEPGEFVGFFGVNTSNVTLKMIIQRMFFTSSQKGQLLSVKPPSPDSITMDKDGLIYTLTRSDPAEIIKKLNIAGKNVLNSSWGFSDTVDIAVDNDGNIFYVTSGGFGFFDGFGRLINANFTSDTSSEIYGVFRQPTGIAVDDDKNIYISDMEKGQIVKLVPTEIAKLIFQGIYYYKEGFYVESMDIWDEVLSLNKNFSLAHNAMAKAHYKLGDYGLSLEEYMLSGDKSGYSDAFWQVRNVWLLANLGYVIIISVVLLIIMKILKEADKRHKIYNVFRKGKKSFASTRLYSEILPVFTVLRHPVDTSDYIKRLKKVSYAGFIGILAVFVIGQIIFNFAKGFVFADNYRADIDIFSIVIMACVPLLVFAAANYLVSTITEGEGSFKGVLVGTVVSFSPVLLFMPLIGIATNFLTQNEAFLFEFSSYVLYGWSLLNLFIIMMNIHDYTFYQTVKNFIITIAAMIVLVIVVLITYVLMNQFIQFVINFR